MAVDTTTFDSAQSADELARALRDHAQVFRARVPAESGTPLLKLGQDGSVLDRSGRVILANTPAAAPRS